MHPAWELPLAIPSFLFYKTMRFTMRRLVVLNARVNRKKAFEWGVLSAESVNLTLALPAIMTTGPRWNTHAIIAASGPFHVRQSISFDVGELTASAGAWTVVFNRFPDQKLITKLGSEDGPFDTRRVTISLPAGHYNVLVRLYHCADAIRLPDLDIDGASAVAGRHVDPRSNDFYRDLGRRRNWFYLCLHYYISTLIRLGRPRRLVESELLPMGNPETRFVWGAVRRGESLKMSIEQPVLTTHDIYFTLYTRDSFPADWYAIREREHVTAPARESGFYLIRAQRKSRSAQIAGPPVRVEIVGSSGAGVTAAAQMR
jgi:hypothetical protein